MRKTIRTVALMAVLGTMAIGCQKGAKTEIPYLFKYRYDQWESCPQRFDYPFEIGKPQKASFIESGVEYLRYLLESTVLNARTVYIPFELKCGNY